MKEVWKPVVGYEGLYEVSSEGRVKSLSRVVKAPRNTTRLLGERLLTPTTEKEGYKVVGLRVNGKLSQKRVHRLVAEAFLNNPEEKTQVNHINEIKSDNKLSNIEWSTSKENSNHGTRIARIVEKRSIPLIATSIESGEEIHFKSSMEAEREGFSNSHVIACCKGNRKTHKGYVWRYA